MSRADGILRVVLTGKWFDMIASGEKREEYREAHWWERLLSERGRILYRNDVTFREMSEVHGDFHPYHTLVASRGYTSRTLSRPIKRIRWGTPRPEWSGDTVAGDCFIIELGDA
jgi:hypothetical protein